MCKHDRALRPICYKSPMSVHPIRVVGEAAPEKVGLFVPGVTRPLLRELSALAASVDMSRSAYIRVLLKDHLAVAPRPEPPDRVMAA